MVPLQRLNAIVVFAVDPAAFTEIDRWLLMLDIPPDQGAGRQTFVYNVENAKAADLAAVLNELFGGGEGGQGGRGRHRDARRRRAVRRRRRGGHRTGRGRRPGRRRRRGSRRRGCRDRVSPRRTHRRRRGDRARRHHQRDWIVGRLVGLRVRVRVAVRRSGGGGSSGFGGGQGGGRTGQGLGRGNAAGGAAGGAPGQPGGIAGVSLPGGPAPPPGPAGTSQGPLPVFRQEVRIVADEVTNSLVVLATKRDYQLILDVVKKIDVVPRQVVLEVMIAEVRSHQGSRSSGSPMRSRAGA